MTQCSAHPFTPCRSSCSSLRSLACWRCSSSGKRNRHFSVRLWSRWACRCRTSCYRAARPRYERVMTFELGVNYWPRRSAMYMWREFDSAEIRDEMAQIADIGFDVVRLFALTEDFLPGPTTGDATM